METHARIAGLACQLAAELAPLHPEEREKEMDYFLEVLEKEHTLAAIPMDLVFEALDNENHSRKVVELVRRQALGAAR